MVLMVLMIINLSLEMSRLGEILGLRILVFILDRVMPELRRIFKRISRVSVKLKFGIFARFISKLF